MHIMRPRKELGLEIDSLHLTLADALRQAVETLRNSQQDLGEDVGGTVEGAYHGNGGHRPCRAR